MQSGVFLILNLGMDWIFRSGVGRLLAQGPGYGWRNRLGLAGIHWFRVEGAVAVAPRILGRAPVHASELLSDLLLAIS